MVKARVIDLDAAAPTFVNARIIAKARLEELYGWNDYIDNPYSIRELHNMRIAAKRLRYTLEIFAEVLPEACLPLLEEITRIQDELGVLHDSDVVIALLRLCLGSQDSGSGYEQALVQATHLTQRMAHGGKGKFDLNPDLLALLVDPYVAPATEARQGLEHFLGRLQERRQEQYGAFRQHWYQLQARGFRRELLAILDASN